MNAEHYQQAIADASAALDYSASLRREQEFPNLVLQKYQGTTIYGTRSTCQMASVINAARLAGYQAKDFQDAIIKDLRVPWDRRNGGVSAEYEVLELMAQIYREYIPGLGISVPQNKTLKRVLADLQMGAHYVVSTGREHAVTLSGLYAGDTGELSSILVNPLSATPIEMPWSRLLTRELQVSEFDEVIVHTTFIIA